MKCNHAIIKYTVEFHSGAIENGFICWTEIERIQGGSVLNQKNLSDDIRLFRGLQKTSLKFVYHFEPFLSPNMPISITNIH